MDTINLHVDINKALASGLFGRLGEERIVLVNATDKERIQRYHNLWASGPQKDREHRLFFDGTLKTGSLYKDLEKWKYELDVHWLRFKCLQADWNGLAEDWDLGKVWNTTKTLMSLTP
ncbi:hypothetical protein F5884DRAFT_868907 [Xylogone sp. PMI_703]|nr:hypothetical protein F5884DRAFT_868907 [Xylogone sp. PMI_703]